MKKLVLVVLAVLLVGGIVYAADNPKDAIAMVDKAVSYFQANGKVKAFAAYDDPKGQFVKGDLYIYVLDMKGDIVSHGAKKKLIGQHFWGIKDTDGKLFFQEIIDKGKKQGTGWVDYKWTNPVSKKVEAKSTYLKKSGEYIICCGIYK
jgi:cytochrome c